LNRTLTTRVVPNNARNPVRVQEWVGVVVPIRRTLAVSLAALVVVLAALVTMGLGAAPAVVGLACGVALCAAVVRGPAATGAEALGPADLVTLTRATLACALAALVADTALGQPAAAAIVPLAVLALVLDAVDGRIARATRTTSSFGARFDGEADAFLLLVLSVHVAQSYGGWVLAIGAARYAFGLAGWMWPWLRITLPFRYWRKVVTAVQGIVLTVAAAGVTDPSITYAALVVALALLTESFGRDVLWAWRHRSSVSSRSSGASGGDRVRVP
jgi:phosphatidylglycerophosphate synthase